MPEFGTDIAATAGFLAALLLTGALAGIMAGLLGVGGGIVIVPVLYHLFGMFELPSDISMHVAVGTSLATIVPTSIASTRAHYRRGSVEPALLRQWAVPILTGSALGTLVAGFVDGVILMTVFASIALIVAANMVLNNRSFTLAPALPRGRQVNFGLGGTIGALSAMMGIGGGTLSVPVLSLFSFPMHQAVGTASALGLLIALPGVVGFGIAGLDVPNRPPLSLGYVNLLAVALIIPMTVLTAPLGATLAHWLNQTWLRRAFALFLALTAVRMFSSLLSQ